MSKVKSIELTKEVDMMVNLNDDKIELSKEAIAEYKAELKKLINEERPEALEQLKEARAQGDLSENADYDAAKDKQAEIEAKITEIETILSRAVALKTGVTKGIRLGSTFTIENQKTKTKMKIKLVNSIEADPTAKPMLISDESPIGVATLGAEKGDIVEVKGPTPYKVRIVSIG